MILFYKIIFLLSVYGILHSYLFYPLLLRWLASSRKGNLLFFQEGEEWPRVSVIMSVYNEESVIEEKLRSLLDLDYPADRLMIYIGSDCSSDRSEEILATYAAQYPALKFYPFKARRGKPGVVNNLAELVFEQYPAEPNHILLMTDANVILQTDTLKTLVRHFKNPEIMLVDAHMVNTGMKADGISKVENQYVSSEVRLKNEEGIVFGKMVGPFGGCYVLRSDHFSPVPPKYLVDDFYIAMRAFEIGGQAINELDALCYEAVSHDLSEEYRRKSRISAGNFQNLRSFGHLLWKGDALSFAFFSHKVLRWLGPFFIIFALLSSSILSLSGNTLFLGLLIGQLLVLIGIPLLDVLSNQAGINVLAFRSVRYFVMMNIALLEGFFKYLKGIKDNVWQPPKRN